MERRLQSRGRNEFEFPLAEEGNETSCSYFLNNCFCLSFAWQVFGSWVATGLASVRSC